MPEQSPTDAGRTGAGGSDRHSPMPCDKQGWLESLARALLLSETLDAADARAAAGVLAPQAEPAVLA